MRIVLLSDTHGFVDPRIVALARGADHVVHAGDVGDRAVLAELRAVTVSLVAVRGNNDVAEKLAAESDDLLDLPEQRILDLPGGELVVLHGHKVNPARQRHELLRRRFAGARAVLYGHTHHAVIDQRGRPWVLNAGAAGRVRTFGGPSCIELTIDARGDARVWHATPRRFPPLAPARPREHPLGKSS